MGIDVEELAKYRADGYLTVPLDFKHLPAVLEQVRTPAPNQAWRNHVALMQSRYLGKHAGRADIAGSQSPYQVVPRINELVDPDAIIASRCDREY